MNAHPPIRLPDGFEPRPAPAPVVVEAGSHPSHARTDHLFRACVARGYLHPLYLPLLKYRQAHAPT